MRIIFAMAAVMVIWSTTPLGIQWSNETLSPLAALFLRMSIASAVGLLALIVMRIPVSLALDAQKLYGASLIGVFGAMSFTYVAAQFIPSGMISVMFALTPMLSSLYARLFLNEKSRNEVMVSCVIALTGLAIIFADDWVMDGKGWIGLALIFIAVNLYAVGGVMVQRQKIDQHPLATTVATLFLSLPFLLLAWWALDGLVIGDSVSSKSILSVAYLAVVGSLVGFACYFYIVSHRGAVSVAMITLITPVFALLLGYVLNQEQLTANMVFGSACVLIALAIYYSGSSVTAKH